MRNAELARCFRDLAAYLEMDDVPFKPRAYEKAAQAIESFEQPLAQVYETGGVKALCDIPGIGKSMAEKLKELVTSGRCALHEDYRRRLPVDVAGLMQNPHADILFHPTGRIIGKREPYDVDMDAIIAATKETGTVLELDAYPERLDLRDEHVRRAITAGVPIVIDSDAHSVKHFAFPNEHGIDQARRGWARAADVLNTHPLGAFLGALKDGRRKDGPTSAARRTAARRAGGRGAARRRA